MVFSSTYMHTLKRMNSKKTNQISIIYLKKITKKIEIILLNSKLKIKHL